MSDTLIAMLTSCTRIEMSPHFDDLQNVVMVVTLYRKKTQISTPYRTDFSDCSKLLAQFREAGFYTAQVDEHGLILERS